MCNLRSTNNYCILEVAFQALYRRHTLCKSKLDRVTYIEHACTASHEHNHTQETLFLTPLELFLRNSLSEHLNVLYWASRQVCIRLTHACNVNCTRAGAAVCAYQCYGHLPSYESRVDKDSVVPAVYRGQDTNASSSQY